MTWYLVFSAISFIGPMTERDCEAAKMIFQSASCRQPILMYSCNLPNQSNTMMACPDFRSVETYRNQK